MIKQYQESHRQMGRHNYKSKDPNNRLRIPYYHKIARMPFDFVLPVTNTTRKSQVIDQSQDIQVKRTERLRSPTMKNLKLPPIKTSNISPNHQSNHSPKHMKGKNSQPASCTNLREDQDNFVIHKEILSPRYTSKKEGPKLIKKSNILSPRLVETLIDQKFISQTEDVYPNQSRL